MFVDRRRMLQVASAASAGLVLPEAMGQSQAQRNSKTLVIAFQQLPRHLNSAVQSGVATGVPAAQIFASPLRFDRDWTPQPYLAESWTVQDDGRSLLLRLVKGATFHDGRPITSEDVAFSIMTIKANHPFQSMFAPVDKVDTPTPEIAIIRMTVPHPALLLALSPPFCPIIPKHIFGDGVDVKTHPRNVNPVGSGPYKLVSFNPREAIVLEKHANFFIKDRPKFERVIFRIIQDPSAAALAVERGEADLMFSPTLSQVSQLEKVPALVVSRKGGDAIGPLGWLAFNLKKKPFDDVLVRQAISYAIDREFIVKQLHRGVTVPATGPIAPGSPFYTRDVELYKLNLERAKALLDQAGLKPNAQGSRFSMSIDFLPNTPDNSQTLAEYLKPQLRKIGIDVSVRTSPDFPTWAKRISSWEFDATMDSSFNYGDPVIGVHRTYLTSNIKQGVIWSNTQNYSNPKVDELLDRATVERDIEKRKRLYHEFQKIVVRDVPVAFTHVWAMGNVARNDLLDVPVSIWAPMVPLDTISRKG